MQMKLIFLRKVLYEDSLWEAEDKSEMACPSYCFYYSLVVQFWELQRMENELDIKSDIEKSND